MPILINTDANRMVVVNLKVMYSTLKAQPRYREVSAAAGIRYLTARTLMGKHPPILLITRNPYARLVSYFNDKFRQHARIHPSDPPHWARLHRLVFPHLGLPPNPPAEEGRERLLKVGFAEAVEMLPKIYRRDGHLVPQSDMLRKIPGVRPEWWLRLIRTAKVEDLDPVEMRQRWDIDVGVRRNSTGGSEDYESFFTPRLYAIVNELYARDFELFGYPRKE